VEVAVLRLETVVTIEVETLKRDALTLAAFPFPMFPVPYGMGYAEEVLLAFDVALAATSTLLEDGSPTRADDVISAAALTLLERS
jgi:hypothetical protein